MVQMPIVDLFETAWHDEDMNEYHAKTSSGDYGTRRPSRAGTRSR